MTVTLSDVQGRFGRDVAGNHTVHAKLEDGSVVCSAHIEIDGIEEKFWFLGHDEFLSDWDLLTRSDAKMLITEASR